MFYRTIVAPYGRTIMEICFLESPAVCARIDAQSPRLACRCTKIRVRGTVDVGPQYDWYCAGAYLFTVGLFSLKAAISMELAA
jgi:hypothetical protein